MSLKELILLYCKRVSLGDTYHSSAVSKTVLKGKIKCNKKCLHTKIQPDIHKGRYNLDSGICVPKSTTTHEHPHFSLRRTVRYFTHLIIQITEYKLRIRTMYSIRTRYQ